MWKYCSIKNLIFAVNYRDNFFYSQIFSLQKYFHTVIISSENKRSVGVSHRLSSRYSCYHRKPQVRLRLFQLSQKIIQNGDDRLHHCTNCNDFFKFCHIITPSPKRGKPITNWLESDYTKKFFSLQKYFPTVIISSENKNSRFDPPTSSSL